MPSKCRDSFQSESLFQSAQGAQRSLYSEDREQQREGSKQRRREGRTATGRRAHCFRRTRSRRPVR
eukprot:7630747-Pyramimonas_sp.AAC.1